MLYIETGSTDPHFNLAAEEYFTKNKTEEICMLWRNAPSIIVGRNQNTMQEIDYEYVTANNIPVVRRMSGGGAVFHDLENLNFTYIVNGGSFGDYTGFTKQLREFVSSLGVECSLSGRNDILADGKKFSGNAQYKWHDRLMHHGTILINADMSRLAAALRPDEEKIKSKGIKSVKSRVVNLAQLLDIDVMRFKDGFERFIKSHGDVYDYKITAEDTAEIEKSVREKYSTFAWNFGYSPKYSFHNKQRFACGSVEIYFDVANGKISKCDIFGDFFSPCGTDSLITALCGAEHDKNALFNAVYPIWQSDMLGGITIEQFLSCLI